jgi:RHS repeat-associated protein
MRLGNSLWEHTIFNNRLQATEIDLGTSAGAIDRLKLSYDYGSLNNGNVQSQSISVPTIGTATGFTLNQSYTYDAVNRLLTAEEMNGSTQVWKQSYTYLDQNGGNGRYGNRRVDMGTDPQGHLKTTDNVKPLAGDNPTISATTNRYDAGQGYSYDAVGNLTNAPNSTFNYNAQLGYDAEGRQVSYDNPQTTTVVEASYAYDADGKRVKKVAAGVTTLFVYNLAGQLVAEYTDAQPTTEGTSYLTSDTLGTERVITGTNINDASGGVKARHDYLPFGEEVSAGRNGSYLADNVRQKFATYERDSETNLDYAQHRYYANRQGRFTSPDPTLLSVNAFNPQSWNRYTYVLNNPLLYVDPLGLWVLHKKVVNKIIKHEDGSTEEVYDHTEVYATKSKDGDDGASLAKQLGLKGKDAVKFAEKIGGGDNVRLSDQGGDVGRVFGRVEKGLTEQKKWEGKHKDELKTLAKNNITGPGPVDCSLNSAQIGLRIPPVLQLGTDVLDPMLDTEAKAVAEGDAQIADIIRYANADNIATHFANFIFRKDDGTPMVFSKSGEHGPYEMAKAVELQGATYGTIRGRNKGDSGYYRKK